MQLAGVTALALALACGTAQGCTIGVSTPGVLQLSANGQTLSSATSGGIASVLAISDLDLDLDGTTITISNVRLDVAPAGFAAPVTFGATYTASWLLGSASGDLQSSPSFTVPPALNLVVTLTLHNTVISTGGFKQGNYSTRITVTCS